MTATVAFVGRCVCGWPLAIGDCDAIGGHQLSSWVTPAADDVCGVGVHVDWHTDEGDDADDYDDDGVVVWSGWAKASLWQTLPVVSLDAKWRSRCWHLGWRLAVSHGVAERNACWRIDGPDAVVAVAAGVAAVATVASAGVRDVVGVALERVC